MNIVKVGNKYGTFSFASGAYFREEESPWTEASKGPTQLTAVINRLQRLGKEALARQIREHFTNRRCI